MMSDDYKITGRKWLLSEGLELLEGYTTLYENINTDIDKHFSKLEEKVNFANCNDDTYNI